VEMQSRAQDLADGLGTMMWSDKIKNCLSLYTRKLVLA